jgi:glycosyltransferase involved in cell wall biosynthesis
MPEVVDGRPFVSVVVPTWNRATLLPGLLDSLLAQDYPRDRFEVVVVDDGSTDDTAAVVRRYGDRGTGPAVRLVQQANGGGNRARNAGIEAAEGAVLAFLDDDETAPATHLTRSVELLAAHPDVAGIGGPAIDDGHGSIVTCDACTLGTAVLNGNEAGTIDLLLSGNMTIPRATFDSVGLFEPALAGRGEETEWFRRADTTFFYEPTLLVWHRRSQFTLWTLCRTQFRYGRGLPRARELQGQRYRPRVSRIGRLLVHAARRRCGAGLVRASRELGAVYEWAFGRLSPSAR